MKNYLTMLMKSFWETKNNHKFPANRTINPLVLNGKILFILIVLVCGASNAAAQYKSVGKLNQWTFNKISSREKNDAILPTAYKMRVSKDEVFDRIVFEFEEKEVPEYTVYYTKPPILLDASHVENPKRPMKDEIVNVKGKSFVFIVFALSFEVTKSGAKFPAGQNLPVVEDVQPVDWFENFFSFAVGLKAKKAFRVQELSNPTRLVVDFKH